MVTFSIICPVYNAKKTLLESVGSVLSQSHSNWELVLIDDGSTDGSGWLCDDLAIRDKRIKVIHQDNRGQSSARLKGIEESSGDYILFLDSDDCYEPNALESLAKEINDNDIDALLYNAKKKTSSGYEDIYSFNEKEIIANKKIILSECFAKRTAGYFWTYCFKKEVFNLSEDVKDKFKNIKYSEDAYLIYQIIKRNVDSLVILLSSLYTYVLNGDSITHTQTVDKVKDRFNVFNDLYADLCENFGMAPIKNVRANTGWMYLSYLYRTAKEYDYSKFKETCLIIRESFIFKKMSNFKKDKLNSLIHFLFKIRMYKMVHSIIRNH